MKNKIILPCLFYKIVIVEINIKISYVIGIFQNVNKIQLQISVKNYVLNGLKVVDFKLIFVKQNFHN